MDDVRRTGRIIGLLIIIQMMGSALVDFRLEAPLFGSPGFLVNAAPHALEIGVAAILGLALEGLWIIVAITLFPILWPTARPLALGLLTLAAVALASAVLESSAVMSMVSFSQVHAKASAPEREQLALVRVIVASARNWPHYMARIIDGVTILVFYIALWRRALVPPILTGLGLIAVVSMLVSVTLPLLGHDVVFPLLAPLGLSQLILALWLMAIGFRGQARPSDAP